MPNAATYTDTRDLGDGLVASSSSGSGPGAGSSASRRGGRSGSGSGRYAVQYTPPDISNLSVLYEGPSAGAPAPAPKSNYNAGGAGAGAGASGGAGGGLGLDLDYDLPGGMMQSAFSAPVPDDSGVAGYAQLQDHGGGGEARFY